MAKALRGFGEFLRYLLDHKEASQRFVFIAQGLAVVISILAVTGAVVFAKNETARSGLAEVLFVLVGGGTIMHFRKFTTQKESTSEQGSERSNGILQKGE